MAGECDFYERFYAEAGEDLREWRLVGAVDKSKSVLELTAGLDISNVIDIGAGTGALLELLVPARPGWNFEAVDISGSAMDWIERLRLPRVQANLFDGVHLDYADATFDLAILSHVVEHLPQTSTLIREAIRIARWVFIEVPVEGTPVLDAIWGLRRIFGKRRIPNRVGHVRFCSRREWDHLFLSHGVSVICSRQYTASKEVLVFGQRGLGLYKARFKMLAERLLTPPVWADLYHSHYAVLGQMLKTR